MVKLSILEPEFIREVGKTLPTVKTIEEAEGVWFLCPKCFEENCGEVGTHMVICWFRNRGVPDSRDPSPGRWAVSGSGLSDLALTPSVHLSGPGCGWHGFIRNGEATIL